MSGDTAIGIFAERPSPHHAALRRRPVLRQTVQTPLPLLLLLSLNVLPTAPPATQETQDRIAGELRATLPLVLQTFVDARVISGGVVAVTDAENTLFETATGFTSLRPQQAMPAGTSFYLASITKPMTATAFMRLVEAGEVSLDAPVSDYLPEFKDLKGPDGGSVVVTVRHCLTHTSGLNDDRESAAGTLAEFVREMASRPVHFAPGSRWQYSRGLDVIGRIAEVTTGLSYEDFMRKQLFEPLGMDHTDFGPPPDGQVAMPYRLVPGTGGLEPTPMDDLRLGSFTPFRPRWAVPSAGSFSTAADLAKFARFLLNRGRANDRQLLSEESVAELTRLQTGDLTTGFTPGNGWALGFCVVRSPQHVTRDVSPGTFGHGGVYGPQFWVDPEAGLAQIILFERSDIGNADGSDVREAVHAAARRAVRAAGSVGR